VRIPLALLLAALASLGAAAVSAAAQEQVVARLDAPAPIAAHQDVVAWSVRDAASGRWSLVTNRGPVPVPTRGAPFDVDLGPGVRDEVVAVYSRCRTETGGLGVYATLVEPWRGCDLYRATLDGREERIAAASSPTADETWPTIWKTRVAFARRYDRKRAYPYLYLNSGSRSRRVPGGPRNACFPGGCSDARRSRPSGLELYGRRLAFSWAYQALGEGPATQLRVHDVDGRQTRTVVDRVQGGGLTGIGALFPAFEGGSVLWMRQCFGDPGGCVRRSGLFAARFLEPRPRRTPFPSGPDIELAHERAGGTTYLLAGATIEGRCRTDPPGPDDACELIALSG
jgi:hypothetical protein